MIKVFIIKQEVLQEKESLISWTGLLTKSNDLSTEILILLPVACLLHLAPVGKPSSIQASEALF